MSTPASATTTAAAAAPAAPDAPRVFVPPPKLEDLCAATAGNFFAGINRPTAGAREDRPLPEGAAPIQLYSLATANGVKVSILLEELADTVGLQYDAHIYNIFKGGQFTSGFVAVNPNSKIPALVDKEGPDGKPINVWESGSINVYLCEKYGKFIPKDPRLRTEVLTWTFWQMAGLGPMMGAGFAHFFAYAPEDKVEAREYGVARYGMEVQRLCSVLDNALEGKQYLVGDEYTLADIMCFPWYNGMRGPILTHASGVTTSDFLSLDQYRNINAWAERIAERPAVKRGLQVCSWLSDAPKPWLAQDAAKP